MQSRKRKNSQRPAEAGGDDETVGPSPLNIPRGRPLKCDTSAAPQPHPQGPGQRLDRVWQGLLARAGWGPQDLTMGLLPRDFGRRRRQSSAKRAKTDEEE